MYLRRGARTGQPRAGGSPVALIGTPGAIFGLGYEVPFGGTIVNSTSPILAGSGVGGYAWTNDGSTLNGAIVTANSTVSTSSFSLLAVVEFASSGSFGSILDRDLNTLRSFQLRRTSTSTIELIRFNTAVSSVISATTVGAVPINTPTAIVAVVRGLNHAVYLGKETARAAITGTPQVFDGVLGLTASWGGTSGTSGYPASLKLNGKLYAYAALPYALSEGEAQAMAQSPAAMYERLYGQRRIIVPLVSAGGGSYTLTAEQGSYTLTGQAAGLLAGRVLAAAQGSYTLSGQDVALLKGNVLTAAQGSYALTGQDVGLLRGLLLSAAQGSYALTGQDATLTYTPLGAFSLTADQGSYALTGQSVSLLWGPVLAAGQGSYTLNGQDATLTYTPVGAYILTAGQGSYALTGQDVLLQWGHVLAAAQGSYTLTGQAATLARGLVLAAAQGSYTLNGQAAVFARTYALSAGYGSYALTGQIVSLTYSGAALEALEYLLLISHITQSMSKTSKVTMEVDLISRIQQQLDGSSSI